MEKELNIAAILKDKSTGTKLYADAFGELSLERIKVNEEDIIYTRSKIFTLYPFYSDRDKTPRIMCSTDKNTYIYCNLEEIKKI